MVKVHMSVSPSHLSKDGVLVLQFLGRPQSEKELASIVIFARVGHSHQTSSTKPQAGVKLVFERGSVDALPSAAGSTGVTALDNKLCKKTKVISEFLGLNVRILQNLNFCKCN